MTCRFSGATLWQALSDNTNWKKYLVMLFAAAITGAAINDPVIQGCEYRVTCTAHSVTLTVKVIGTSRTGN
jgi:hypothetical protein